MWTSENRARYDRSQLRYPSDLTDDEWGLVEPLIPPGKRGGDKRTVIMREVVNGLMYILSHRLSVAGHPERPAAALARSTTISICGAWDGTLDRIHHALYEQCREAISREASPDRRHHRQPERQKRGKRCYGASGETAVKSSLRSTCN